MNDHCCKGCDFFAPTEGKAGKCHRHPPTVGVTPLGRVFPTVYESDWCGEHRPVRLTGANLTPREARHTLKHGDWP